MKKILSNLFRHLVFSIILLLLNPSSLFSQGVAISDTTITPHASSILELRSTTQGLLAPRMTIIQRDAIILPATGLVVYNTIDNQFNFYNGNSWVVWGSTAYLSVDAGSTLTTSSTSDVVITDMSKTATETGTYLALFNGQVTIAPAVYTTGFSTATAAADLGLIFNDIMAIPATNTTHPLTFGSGETLLAGVYDIAGAASIAGTLTLDGGGNPDALFVIRATGAFNTGAGVNVILTKGASAKNIFWVATGAIGLGASTTIQGSLLSGAAVAVGATSTVTGRLLTRSGAISFGPSTLSIPTGSSFINFRSLSNFVIFTSLGGIANAGASIYTGDIGTNGGAITAFEVATVNGIIFQGGSTTVTTTINTTATFSLYKNGVLIPNSSRTRTRLTNPSDISLQGIATVIAGDIIDVRWKIDTQPSDSKEVSVINRILTLIKVSN